MASFASDLYRAARLSASGRAVCRTVETGDPSYALPAAPNLAGERTLARAGVWRQVWGKW
jgi:hypothetical protein